MRRLFCTGLVLVVSYVGGAMSPPTFAAPTQAKSNLADLIRKEAGGRYEDFYQSRNYKPLWIESGRLGPAASDLIAKIADSRADGLNPADYDLTELRALVARAKSGNRADLAAAELGLSQTFAHFVADMREPEKAGMTFLDKSVKPRKRGAEVTLRAASMAPSLRTYIAKMGWMSPHYVRQRTIMARLMNGGRNENLRRQRLNLERARILPSAFTHHIIVDAASGQLWYYQAGSQKGTMRVIVGKPDSPTPMYAGVIQYAVIRPYWNVPVDLTRKLIAPKVLAGKSLASMGYEALSNWGTNPRVLKPSEIDWRAVASGERELRVRQLPGPKNSMGKVKFMFPNETGIFLHDTPDRKLFAKTNRHFSNGCVRLEDAARLGTWLMGRPLPTSSTVPDQAVMLSAAVPIYMTYFTGVETKTGVRFLADVYNRDGLRNRAAQANGIQSAN
jgi:L,D-transpeptidase YcbB